MSCRGEARPRGPLRGVDRTNYNAERVFANILRYAREFPERELGVMLVTDMHRSIGRPLYAVPEFKEWAESVTDLLFLDRT